MKERELRNHTTCDACGKKLGETGLPIFWVVTTRRYGLDAGALQRQQGLTMMFGGHAELAQIMGPDEDMAKPLTDTIKLTICEKCATNLPEAGESALPIGLVALEKNERQEGES